MSSFLKDKGYLFKVISFLMKAIAVKELSEEQLYQVARRLTKKSDIRRLGLKLGVEGHRINAIFYNKRDDITEAAYDTLNEWRKDQPDAARAWITLRDALIHKDVNLAQVARESLCTGKVLQWHDHVVLM